MGYTTEFRGRVEIAPPLTAAQILYVNKFCNTRRMKRDAKKAAEMPDPLRIAVNLPIGDEAGFFVGGLGYAGQDRDPSILNYNEPPKGQPGLWCQWEITDDGRYLQWNGAEKFYNYVEWMAYLIDHVFKSWRCVLTGRIEWQGEEEGDTGVIVLKENVVSSRIGADQSDVSPSWIAEAKND